MPITDGKLDLGPWEQVFYAEFDGQRKKRVVVKVMGVGAGARAVVVVSPSATYGPANRTDTATELTLDFD